MPPEAGVLGSVSSVRAMVVLFEVGRCVVCVRCVRRELRTRLVYVSLHTF